MNEGDVRISFHQSDSLLKFMVIHPEIIAGTIGYILASASQQTVEVIVEDPLVAGVAEEAYLGITGGIIATDSRGIVRRAVFAYDDLYGLVALLTEDGVKGACDGLLLIIGGDDD